MRARGLGRGGEEGQMLILAGTVLVLAFLVAAFAITELGGQEAALEQGPSGQLAEVFHETRDEFAAAMHALTIPSTDADTLREQFAAQRQEFEERGRAHGLFVVMELGDAFNGTEYASRDEGDYADGSACGTSHYTMLSYNLTYDYVPILWDCTDDGILWDLGPAQRIQGMVVYLAISNEAARVDETFVLGLN